MKSSNLILLLLLFGMTAGCGGGSGSGTAVSPAGTGNSTATSTTNPSGGGGSTTSATGAGTSGSTSSGTAPGGSGGTATTSGGTTSLPPAANVLSVTVNGALCSSGSYPNKPCVAVTVCTPGTSTCQTISDILLDTGSYGLRIFKQALSVPLSPVTSNAGPVAECVQFGDGSSEWGPVQTASVILGNEPAVQLPVQIVDAAFGTPPTACNNADQSPSAAGFNGILGVGLFAEDCGATCANSANNGMYYACSGAGCSGAAVSLANQVQNPVALLPQDNNGVIVQLPGVPPGGSGAVNGYLVLGIDTQANNASSGVTKYAANQYGEFTTTLGGTTSGSFIDSGSNGLFFTSPSATLLPNCSSPDAAWFCPGSETALSATNSGAAGSGSGTVAFQVGNFFTLVNSGNSAFADLGGDSFGGFDWGLPFYFGRNVFAGIQGKRSSLGSGPYWAY